MKKYSLIIDDRTTEVIKSHDIGFGLAMPKQEGKVIVDLCGLKFESIRIIPKKLSIKQKIKLIFTNKI